MSHKHAPRGPVKARDPLQSAHPLQNKPLGGDARRCSASSKRTGKPCTNPAMKGGAVCRMHGGKAPQVMASSAFRVMEAYKALQPKAVFVVEKLLDRDEYPTVQIAAVREVMDRTEGKPTEQQRVEHSGGMTIRHVMGDD